VLFGYRARLRAWLPVVFLVPVTLSMHNFWAASDPMTFQIQLTLFTRNLLLLGGALFIAHVGAGSLSLDALMAEPVAELSLVSESVPELDYGVTPPHAPRPSRSPCPGEFSVAERRPYQNAPQSNGWAAKSENPSAAEAVCLLVFRSASL